MVLNGTAVQSCQTRVRSEAVAEPPAVRECSSGSGKRCRRDSVTIDAVATNDELISALLTRKAELTGEVAELSEPIRAPGVQVQFGKRAGDHTSDAVMQMERTVAAEQLDHLSGEIDRALAKLAEGTYGRCDACGGPIASERLEALPWATRCIACKAAGRLPPALHA
jgi:DnaK suppressor protein